MQAGSVDADSRVAGRLSDRRVLAGWLLAVAGTGALTTFLVSLGSEATALETMLYLALAVACALLGGRWPAVAASVLGALALNYYFTAPLHTLRITSTANVVALIVFVAVSVAVAAVVDSAARRRTEATLARREADTLAMLNRQVLGGEHDVPGLLALVRDHFGARAAELVETDTELGPDDSAAPASATHMLALRGRRLGAADHRVLSAFATHVGVIGQRDELARQTQAAHELEVGNRTRTALLAAVSHDLRTPLAGIQAATDTLLRHGGDLAGEDRDVLLAAIGISTTRLTAIVTDLLDMSRLQAGGVEPLLAAVAAGDVLARVLDEVDQAGRVTVAEPLPSVRADPGLLERVLANLVANALHHTDDPVEVRAEEVEGQVRLAVVDHGPGVAPDERSRMFEPFQQLGDGGRRDGVGLGLAVARGLTEAQGGTLAAEATPGGGLTMVVVLKALR